MLEFGTKVVTSFSELCCCCFWYCCCYCCCCYHYFCQYHFKSIFNFEMLQPLSSLQLVPPLLCFSTWKFWSPKVCQKYVIGWIGTIGENFQSGLPWVKTSKYCCSFVLSCAYHKGESKFIPAHLHFSMYLPCIYCIYCVYVFLSLYPPPVFIIVFS